MIRGYFATSAAHRRPFVNAHFDFPSLGLAGDIPLLVDTGADPTVLAPADAGRLEIPLAQLPSGPPSAGVGGTTLTVSVPATLTLDARSVAVTMRILTPQTPRQQRTLRRIPSLLGRDILSRFALFMEERSQRVLLLEPHEADALSLT